MLAVDTVSSIPLLVALYTRTEWMAWRDIDVVRVDAFSASDENQI